MNQLQNSDIGCYDHFEVDLNKIAVLHLDLYLQIEKPRKIRNQNAYDSESDPLKRKLLQEGEHIHNKALFDAVNESLVQFWRYDKDGEPMPWSSKVRKLKFPFEEMELQKIFDIVK